MKRVFIIVTKLGAFLDQVKIKGVYVDSRRAFTCWKSSLTDALLNLKLMFSGKSFTVSHLDLGQQHVAKIAVNGTVIAAVQEMYINVDLSK